MITYTNTPTHQHTNTPTHQHTNTPTHQHTNTPTHQHTNTPTHQHTNTPSLLSSFAVLLLSLTLVACDSGGSEPAAETKDTNSDAVSTFEKLAATTLTAYESGSEVKLSWKAISIATRYEIYRHTKDESKSATQIKALSVSATSYTDSPGVGTFYYWLKVCNSRGCSDYSKSVSFVISQTKTVVEKPTEPTKLTASLDVSSKAILSWQAVPTATSYEIYLGKSTDSRAADKQAETTSGVTTHTQEIKAGTFYYWLKACNSSGCSSYSQKVTLIKLAAPTILSPASATVTNSQISLSWRAVSGVTKYEIYRGASTNPSEATKIVRSSTKDTEISYTGSIDSGTFHYWLKACNSYGCSDFSTRSARTKEATKEPTAPTELTASLNDSSKAILSWKAIATAKSYKIYRNIKDQSSDAPEITSSDNKLTANSYTESIAANTYFYWVQACNDHGCSGYSDVVSLTKLAAPTTLSATVEDSKASLSWDAVTGVTKYQIYRNDTEDKSSDAPEITSSSLVVTDNNYKESIDVGTYFYWVKACNADGCSDHSKTDSLTKLAAPAALTVTVKGTRASLSWATVPDVTKYEIYRHTKEELSTATKIASPSPTTNNNDYPDTTTTIVAGTLYYYWLKVCNSDGCSDVSTVVRLIKPFTPTLTAKVEDSKASLSWSPSTNFASYYEIYRGSSSSDLTTKIADISGDVRSYTQEINTGTFYYGIKACNSYGCSDLSTVVSLTKLTAPIKLTAEVKDSKASLSWEAVSGSNKYRIYKSTKDQSSDAPEITSSDNGVTGINYTDPTALVAGTPYYYWLKACNDDGCSDHSKTASLTKLTAPTLTASLDDESKASFSWSAIDNATGYAIYRHTTNEPSKAQKITADSVTGITHTASIAAGTFYYWLQACNSDGCSDYSQSVSLTKLAAPTKQSAKVEGSQVSFSWEAVTGATKYEIHRGASTNPSEATKIDRPSTQDTATSYTESIDFGTFNYWLKACNNAGCSDFSAVITLTKAPLTKPTVPTDLTAKLNALSQAKLSWTGINAATHYKIYKNTEDKSSGAKEITPPLSRVTENSYIDLTTDVGIFHYWLKACNSKGCSGYSDVVRLIKTAPPSSITVTWADSEATLGWGYVNATNYYEIYRHTEDNSSKATEITSSSNVTRNRYTDSTINVDTYYYWLKSCNNTYGCSDYSDVVSLTKLAVPTKLTAKVKDTEASEAILSWEAVTDATKYKIYRNTEDNALRAKEITSSSVEVTENNYTDSNDAGTLYYYWLKACNSNGCTDFSKSVSFLKLYQAYLRLSKGRLRDNSSDVKAKITWQYYSSGVTRYEIYKQTTTGAWEKIADTSSDVTNYVESITAGSSATYSVKACNDSGCTNYSDSVTLKKPAVPEPLTATGTTSDVTDVTLSWDDIDGVSLYKIYRHTEDKSSDATKITTRTSNDDYVDYSNPDTSYYWLQVCSSYVCSEFSTVVIMLRVYPPKNIAVKLEGSKAILSWDAVSHATKYEVYKKNGSQKVADITADVTRYTEEIGVGTHYYHLKTCNNSYGCSAFSSVYLTRLGVPTNLTTKFESSKVKLSWQYVTGATKFEIYKHDKENSSDAKKIDTVTSESLEYIDSSATVAGTTYYYWIKACNKDGCSSHSNGSSITKLVTPILTAEVNGGVASLSWKAVTDATEYKVYRNSEDNLSEAQYFSPISKTMPTENNSYTYTYTYTYPYGGEDVLTYYYWVKACSSSGLCSDYSDGVRLTKLAAPTATEITAELKYKEGNTSEVFLSWKAVTGATKYEVYRGRNKETVVADITADGVTSYTGSISVGKHYYWLKACNSDGCSDYSQSVILTKLAVPTTLTVKFDSETFLTVHLSWKNVTGALSHDIYKSEKDESSKATKIGSELITSSDESSGFRDPVGLVAGTLYYYWLRACNGGGCSDFSDAVSLIKLAPPTKITAKVKDTAGKSEAFFSWEAVPHATKYEVYKGLGKTNVADITADDVTSYTEEIAVGIWNNYYLKACNSDGCSAFSTVIDLKKFNAPQMHKTAVLSRYSSDVKARISWYSSDALVSRYEIYRQTTEDDARKKIADTSSDVTNYAESIAAGSTATYWVKVCGVFGCSDYSDSVTLKKPVTPQPLTARVDESLSVILSWGTVTDATSYRIHRHTTDQPSEATRIQSPLSNSGYTDKNAPDTSYYWLQACNDSMCSEFSTVVSLKKLSPPTTLTVKLDDSDSKADLSWTEVSGATKYEIYRHTEDKRWLAGKITTEPEVITATSYTDSTTVVAGTLYYYWLKACNNSGCSGHSSVASLIKLVAPKILSRGITNTASDSTAWFTWSVIANATKYEVYRTESFSAATSTKIKDILKKDNVTTYTEVITPGKPYYYRLKACNDAGCSDYSAVVSLIKLDAPTVTINVTGEKDRKVSLSWAAVSVATRYDIYRNKTGIEPSTEEAKFDTSLGSTSYTGSITAAGMYYYWVKACDAPGCSDFSNAVSALKTAVPLNDTGINVGGNHDSNNNSGCTSNFAAPQDCNHGRDAQARAGTLTKTGGGSAGFDFTKLGASGDALTTQNGTWSDTGNEASGTLWSCVRDNVTGLVWEVKVATGLADTSNNIHHKDNLYRWGGITAIGRDNPSSELDYYDDWNTLVNGSNDADAPLCGYSDSDWRVPKLYELVSILDYRKTQPSIDTDYFPNTANSDFWSASPSVYGIDFKAKKGWSVEFSYSSDRQKDSLSEYRLRLVRGD